ncbi:MAG: hypothetical protein KJP16_04265 [Gammaproteobacteria bacterium]|nr:hypothetical protein [Gammaproteobacteria bacterium]NNL50010.1 hypothetical protein [Woeseiaceae bacterium]
MTRQDPEIRKEHGFRAFVDAHVHIHGCFSIQDFLSAAAANFSHHAERFVSGGEPRYVLCLTESCGVDEFTGLSRLADDKSEAVGTIEAMWRFEHSGDDRCLIASHPVLGEIEIVAGRQIVTAERLEILALGSLEKWEDGQAAADIVESVVSSGAIPVLPWGFGKWMGRRRRVVEDLIRKFGGGSLYLGDNSGRPSIMTDPPEFVLAQGFGMRILPGSDPLPFSSEYDRAGSFGFYVDNVSDGESVWTGLRAILQQENDDIHHFGSLESPLRFLRNQVAMQYVTRISSRRQAI